MGLVWGKPGLANTQRDLCAEHPEGGLVSAEAWCPRVPTWPPALDVRLWFSPACGETPPAAPLASDGFLVPLFVPARPVVKG